MPQIVGFAVAPAEPGEDADHLGVALGGQHRPGGGEALGVETGKGGQVTAAQGGDQAGIDVAPGVFQQRHQVIGRAGRPPRPENPAGRRRRPRPPVHAHQVVDMEIAQHQGRRHGPGEPAEGGARGRGNRRGRRRRAEPAVTRNVPIRQKQGLGQTTSRVVIGRQHLAGMAAGLCGAGRSAGRPPGDRALPRRRRPPAGG